MSDSLKVSENVKVYRDPAGIKLSLVLLQPAESKQALLEVTGSDTSFDKLVRLHSREESNRGESWKSQVKGSDWYTLRFERNGWSNEEYAVAWLPGKRDGVSVQYDAEASEKANGEDLLNRHLRQKQDGTLAKLATFDRTERVAEQQKGIDELRRAVEAECGTSLDVSVEWNGLTDEALRTYSVASYLTAPLEALQRLVSRDKDFYAPLLKARIQKVHGAVGPRPALRLADGTLTWQTDWEASNLGDFCLYVLMNELNK